MTTSRGDDRACGPQEQVGPREAVDMDNDVKKGKVGKCCNMPPSSQLGPSRSINLSLLHTLIS